MNLSAAYGRMVLQKPVDSLVQYSRELCDSLPRFDRSVSWLGWAYNEEELIEGYLRRAHALLSRTVEDFEIVIVDDGSTDRTAEIIESVMLEIPQIRFIRNSVNMNVGYSSRRAIASASKDYLFWQTVDWSYDIDYLRIFLELLKTHDIVAGVRRAPVEKANRILLPFRGALKLFGIKHLTRRSDTVSQAIISVVNYVIIRTLFRVPLSDYQNVVLYPTLLIKSIGFEAESSFVNPEALIKAYWSGASFAEVPISFLPRQGGDTKGTRLRALARSIYDILALWYRWVVLGRIKERGCGSIDRLRPDQWDLDDIR